LSGDPARALYHHKQFYSLQKDTVREQDQLRLKNLQAMYELEQATKEAQIYRLENIELVSANAKITQQKEDLERQTETIREANIQLRHQNDVLEYMNREKDEFLGITVHGLKNPITNIALAVAMLKNRQRSMSGNEIEASLDWIESTVWRMDDIVQKLLQSNALEAGKVQLHPVSLALPSLVLQVVENYNNKAAAKNIKLVMEKDSEDMVAYADPEMTEDVIDNLVSNAIKFSPAHATVRVRIYHSGTHQQQESSTTGNANIYIAVQDEGPGITTEDRKRLFGRFERLSAKPTGGEQSSGLGLSIVKQLTEKMNGHVWCESDPGKGATFIVELPLPPRLLDENNQAR
jgi:signal transduction histidine kinase